MNTEHFALADIFMNDFMGLLHSMSSNYHKTYTIHVWMCTGPYGLQVMDEMLVCEPAAERYNYGLQLLLPQIA